MGTNYYHRTNVCDCCGRYDEQHICKSLVTFEAPVMWDDEKMVHGVVLTSWREWRDHIRAGGEVWNEYGEQIEVEDFIARVEATEPDARRRQFDWCAAHPLHGVGVVELAADWLDADGFSFYGGEFS